MLTRITGQLERVEPASNAGSSGCASCVVALEIGLAYEALLPSYTAASLLDRIGQPLTLHTVELYEQGASGGNITPRLLGFLREDDRRFFEALTKVKGLGPKRALRMMAAPTGEIAAAAAREDAKFLKTLPEVGPKLAETIARELKGKVDAFVDRSAGHVEVKGRDAASAASAQGMDGLNAEARQAALALVRLGQSEPDAERMVRAALERDESLTRADDILAAAFGAR
ncbi:MAG: Holliday junction branch migration protein RuvA [Phycisphaerales bacterium]